MGNHVSRTDFEWTDQEEPHAKRRTEILSEHIILHEFVLDLCHISKNLRLSEKYPQIKKLFGVDTTFKWKVISLVILQLIMLQLLKDMSWPVVFITAYLFGGVINHALMLGNIPMSF